MPAKPEALRTTAEKAHLWGPARRRPLADGASPTCATCGIKLDGEKRFHEITPPKTCRALKVTTSTWNCVWKHPGSKCSSCSSGVLHGQNMWHFFTTRAATFCNSWSFRMLFRRRPSSTYCGNPEEKVMTDCEQRLWVQEWVQLVLPPPPRGVQRLSWLPRLPPALLAGAYLAWLRGTASKDNLRGF